MSFLWETAVSLGAEHLVDQAKKQGWFHKMVNVFRKKHNVIVLGTTGAGKTNMIQSLTEFMPDAIPHMNRTEVMQQHNILIDNQPFIFIDTPGQEFHKSRRISAIRESMTQDIAFVLNVVAYGYHEYRAEAKDAFNTSGEVSDDYLQRHRAIETRALSEWTTLLGNKRTARGLITVVSKADLWWSEEIWMKVLHHYEGGEYYKALGDASSLDPVVLPYCSVFHKFFGQGKLSGRFDEKDRLNARVQLLSTMLAIVGRGA